MKGEACIYIELQGLGELLVCTVVVKSGMELGSGPSMPAGDAWPGLGGCSGSRMGWISRAECVPCHGWNSTVERSRHAGSSNRGRAGRAPAVVGRGRAEVSSGHLCVLSCGAAIMWEPASDCCGVRA